MTKEENRERQISKLLSKKYCQGYKEGRQVMLDKIIEILEDEGLMTNEIRKAINGK